MLKVLFKLLSGKGWRKSSGVSNADGFDAADDVDVLVVDAIGDSDDLGEPVTGRWARDDSNDSLFGVNADPITGEIRDSVFIRPIVKLQFADEIDDMTRIASHQISGKRRHSAGLVPTQELEFADDSDDDTFSDMLELNAASERF